jgi:hypothetical protein
MITSEYFLALMAGVGIGTTIVLVGYLLWTGACALDARVAARIVARLDTAAAQRRQAAAVANAVLLAEQSDRDYAVRLAELDARNERLVTPTDRATV